VIAFANQKGGVAKTTTVHSLGDALIERGRSVLLVDLDPQACLTYAVGVDIDALETTLHDVFVGRATAGDIVLECEPNLAMLPASIDLAGAEVHLLSKTGREQTLARALKPLVDEFDYTLIDCSPSLGVLTINGLTAAHYVAIPFQCETLSNRGVGQLLETVEDVHNFTNDRLKVLGVIATMFDGRTRLAQEVLADVTKTYHLELLEPPIPKSIRVAEAPGRGLSVLRHAPGSPAAEAYRALADSIEARV
jgi:chromosome partitioning protein